MDTSEGDNKTVIQVQTATTELVFDLDDGRVHPSALLTAWDGLLPLSVEATVANRPNMYEFANTHSLLFAAVLVQVVQIVVGPPVDPSPKSAISLQPIPTSRDANLAKYFDLDGDQENPTVEQPSDGTDDPARVIERRTVWNTAGLIYVSQSEIPQQVHIGVGILPNFQNKGVARQACNIALDWSVSALQAHRVQARIMSSPHINRTRSLFASLGFSYEGLQRRIVANAAGEWVDVVHMGILDTDWCIRTKLASASKSLWDELLERHQREVEELLREEERRKKVHKSNSMETIRVALDPQDLGFDSRGRRRRSPSPLSATSSSLSSRSSSVAPESAYGSCDEREMTPLDAEAEHDWVRIVGGIQSAENRTSNFDEPMRPPSTASLSSYGTLGTTFTVSSGVRSMDDN
ncbi:hypothetical protein ONZ51_g2158 [Trametes cubensis]|uniref:N-acetyltransferase domain-containing protein n=1 Tax=Trametes cubensis TaxID=1111947 RepID=A0AAD7XF36_9APHY|nr:hypothetical protein ONZ51_g2158 [Trametes cubensis]